MSKEHPLSPVSQLESWLGSKVYLQNLAFWDRAWNMVKVPYTQMPDLPYLSGIPEHLQKAGTRRVLDLGCGSGWLSIYLARAGFYVTGIDLAKHAIELGANSIFEHLTYELAVVTIKQLKSILIPGGTFFGCFDKVGGGPGEYYSLEDGTHVYTDKGRQGMLLRFFNDEELQALFSGWRIEEFATLTSGSRIIWARS
jgi:hypothetical protein